VESAVLIIKSVLNQMSFQDIATAAERSERERLANVRLAEIEAAAARKKAAAKVANRRRIRELGRPEYMFAKNAERKEAQRQRYREWIAWEKAFMEKKRYWRRKARLEQGRSEW